MKRFFSVLLVLTLVCCMLPVTTSAASSKHILNGKKVLMIGNSLTYYGKTVIRKLPAVLTQEERSNDTGYFYEICKRAGAKVSVTNWTFAAHEFNDLFDICGAKYSCNGQDHLSYLTDRYFDYVILQESGNAETDLLGRVENIMEIFRQANPNVQFLFSVPSAVYFENKVWRDEIELLKGLGVTIVDWGALVYDIVEGYAPVPNARQEYTKNSFIIRQSALDGKHPNMLTGYLSSLMLYCAITGESAIGQDWSFCCDTKVNSNFNATSFIKTYYCYQNATTNFTDIFASTPDMLSLQKLVDQYVCPHDWPEEYTTDVAPTCAETGKESLHCRLCGRTTDVRDIPKTDKHTWDTGLPTKLATTTSEGLRTYTCTVCGNATKTTVVAMLSEQCDGGTDCRGHAFSDMPKATIWDHAPIDFAVANGLFNGVSKTTFSPNDDMTRAMFVTVLSRLACVVVKNSKKTGFSDVARDMWYTGAVKWAADAGIVSGTGPKTFEPDAPVTREQICKMMVEYCSFAKIKLKNVNAPSTFKDAKKISGWAKTYVSQAQQSGFVNGNADGTFKPKSNATRAQVATIFMNFAQNYGVR